MRFKIDWACLIVGKKFTVFALYLSAIFKYKPPGGPYIRRGDLTKGFLRYEFGGLIFGGAYTWRGLFSEFYGILLGTRSLVGTPSGVSKFDFSDNFVSKNLAQIHNFTS